MKINKKLKYWGFMALLFGALLTLSYKYYPEISDTFGITVSIKTGYTTRMAATISKATANNIMIQPVTGNIEVVIPANSFAKDLVFTLETKLALPAVDRATVKLSKIGISMTAVPALQPVKDLIVTIRYRAEDIIGLEESKLAISRYDESGRKWLVLRSTVYMAEKKVTALTNHLSIFAIIQNAAAVDLNGTKVYPNPWNPAVAPLGVVIDGLTKTAEIRIYTVAGELVTVLNETDGNGRSIWNGKNSEGNNAASGIYIAVVKNGSELKRVKIGIERR
ncbi:MAG: hypothetical protein A2231_11185 [Candidatus Firestonebacteria bacterium RIFOXYA2_FULL_40_8]|nr:MAG: hypothetical protein A2231_11185 [Candidatus Firestonebacteria bacterium RIFOXYA2_FULL_40_8]